MSQTAAGRQPGRTPWQSQPKRQAVHEPTRPTTYRTLRPLSPHRPVPTYKSAIHEASSGQNTRHRLNRRGDRQLNRALHTIAVTRSRYCPHTQAHIAKRTAQGKTPREAQRCLKRYIARQIYRLLQHPKINT